MGSSFRVPVLFLAAFVAAVGALLISLPARDYERAEIGADAGRIALVSYRLSNLSRFSPSSLGGGPSASFDGNPTAFELQTFEAGAETGTNIDFAPSD